MTSTPTDRTSEAIDPRRYRDVLGHYPTGVVVITAIDGGGAPLGMAVGSFTSVSLDPPLVAFLPDRGSTTFPAIRAAAGFCVNVLAGTQEALCRSFAMKGANRFDGVQWDPAPHTGSPILRDSVAWIDCTLEEVHDAGDHHIVIGHVHHLDIQHPTVPLVFFQGGYGTFAPPSLVLASRKGLSEQVRLGDAARSTMEELSARTGIESRAMAVEDDHLVIVATAGSRDGVAPVGAIIPFSPPFGSTLVAWAGDDEFEGWVGRYAAAGEADRSGLVEDLDRVRRTGWSMTFDTDKTREAGELVDSLATLGRTPNLERRLVAIGAMFGRLADPDTLTDDNAHLVRTVSAPVFDSDGDAVLHLTLYNFPAGSTRQSVLEAKDALVQASTSLSRRLSATSAPEHTSRTSTWT
jgi:flavin reductase (DIM6/NTAB) family NADH-FMN oxidoreductase RutF/DNA-binding IclR family transcriptional regulator